ncbi:MAG: hypothetical protein ACK56I_16715, partial [bacterium]
MALEGRDAQEGARTGLDLLGASIEPRGEQGARARAFEGQARNPDVALEPLRGRGLEFEPR